MPVLETPDLTEHTASRADIAALLETLVAENTDAARMLREAADKATTGNLRLIFLRYSTGREGFARELLAVARDAGIDAPRHPESLRSTARRAWLSVRTAVSLADDSRTLREVERCGKRLVTAYHDALRLRYHLPPDIEGVLRRQADAVAIEYDRIRSLCEIYQCP